MKRYAALDLIRSVAIINMIIYHAIWDLVYIFGVECRWYSSSVGYIWQQGICWSFILLSGFCASMGRKKFKRGVVVFLCGVIVSLTTLITIPENRILFGILTLIGSCMLITSALHDTLKKINPTAGLIVCFAVFILTKNIGDGFISIGSFKICELPESLYINLFSAYFGFPPSNFYSTDYFPVIPWTFLFFTGYFLNKLFIERGLMKYLDIKPVRILQIISRYSLLIYMLHQPIIYFMLVMIVYITGLTV